MQKKTRKSRGKPGQKNAVLRAIKGAVFALLISILGVLIFALIIKETAVDDGVISAVNQILKVVCIFAAALIAARRMEQQRLMAGAMAGGMYVVLAYLTFSLIQGDFGDIMTMFADLAMGVIIGLLTGAIFGRLGMQRQKQAR